MEEVTITADPGRPTGSRASRRLRGSGKVPAVLYGHGTDPQALAVDARELRTALTGEAGLNALITLRVNSESHLAMARHLQRHPGGILVVGRQRRSRPAPTPSAQRSSRERRLSLSTRPSVWQAGQ